jgi:molybdopterin-guanine dinucleotide biosynthesis protein A
MHEDTKAHEHSASAVILAGGSGKRFGSYKPLFTILGLTLLEHLERRIGDLYGEVLVVAGTEAQRQQVQERLGRSNIITDEIAGVGPLSGILTGTHHTNRAYCQILPVDSPLPAREILEQLLASARGYDAVVPRWKDGRLEPLHAVYRTEAAAREAKRLIEEGQHSVISLVESLGNVRYLGIDELRKLDPVLDTFTNINTPEDLEKIISKLRQT